MSRRRRLCLWHLVVVASDRRNEERLSDGRRRAFGEIGHCAAVGAALSSVFLQRRAISYAHYKEKKGFVDKIRL